jgi:hypothetical protein
VFKSLGVGALALVLAACGSLKAPRTAQGAGESIPRPVLPSGGRNYRIDTEQSELRILVYRAGPLAKFGHNHVMVNRRVHGAVNLADAGGTTVFSLIVPAAGFVVDDAEARSQEGPDFPGEIPDEAKSGTLHNMLSASVLDADEFPEITVKSVAVLGAQGVAGAADSAGTTQGAAAQDAAAQGATPLGVATLTATVAISVAGHESTIDVPFTLRSDPNRLSATGSLELRQSTLGLTPYSLLLGALQVQDTMTIKFTLVAVPG